MAKVGNETAYFKITMEFIGPEKIMTIDFHDFMETAVVKERKVQEFFKDLKIVNTKASKKVPRRVSKQKS